MSDIDIGRRWPCGIARAVVFFLRYGEIVDAEWRRLDTLAGLAQAIKKRLEGSL
jgi:hypothetical protein